MKSKIENCLYMQVAHCSKCGGQSGYNIYDGEKICFDCGESYEADFHILEVESTITTTNSQDQEEENTVCEGCGKTITSRFMQSYTKGDGMHSYCLSCDPEKQDTPEQKEGWEFDLRNLMYRDGEQLRCAREGEPYTGEYRELVISMVKNLLLEREKEAYFKGKEYQAKLDRDCYGVSFEKLSKLTTK